MKIYIVIGCARYEGCDNEKAFDSKEKAEKYITQLYEFGHSCSYCDRFNIEEMEVG